MIRRIFQLIAIAWCVTAVSAALADASAPGAGQDSDGADAAAASAPAQAAPLTTAQNDTADDEQLKVFGFMPRHKPKSPASPDSAADQATAASEDENALTDVQQAAETDRQPTVGERAAPAAGAVQTAPEQKAAPAPAVSEAPPAAQPGTAAGDQQDTGDMQTGEEAAAEAAPVTASTTDTAQEAPEAAKEDHVETHPQDVAPAATPHEAAHWSYSGAGAPPFWAGLKPAFATCGAGKHQSPIDISTATITALPKLRFDYHATPLRVVNNGHSIQVNYQQGSAVVVDGKRYDLVQVHFHTPSEHTMGGKAYPMVAHLVHKAADGELLVIAVLMQTGASNPLIARIWQELPSAAGQIKVADEQSINAADLLPTDTTYFTYSGSLTTPPCTEGVKWVVLSAPVKVSEAQVDTFAALFPRNARPVKPLNGRTVLFSN